jgi:hypothetical protein
MITPLIGSENIMNSGKRGMYPPSNRGSSQQRIDRSIGTPMVMLQDEFKLNQTAMSALDKSWEENLPSIEQYDD